MPAITPRATAERFLRATISPDPGDLADFYASDVVIEMPFAPAGLYPARIETTREELRTRFRAGRRGSPVHGPARRGHPRNRRARGRDR